jgi:tetratricopeptide (TPR) repeat protein
VARKTRNKTTEQRPPASPAPAPRPRAKSGQGWRFWAGLAVFQIVFGASIFVLTRAHYERPSAAAAQLVAEHSVTVSSRPAFANSSVNPFGTAGLTQPLPATDLTGVPTAELRRSGSARFTAGDYAQAARHYTEVLRREPNNTDLRNNLAISLHHAGQSIEAVARLRVGLDNNPGHQRSWLTLGFIKRATGDISEAMTALKQAVDIDPGSTIGQEAAQFLATLDTSTKQTSPIAPTSTPGFTPAFSPAPPATQ